MDDWDPDLYGRYGDERLRPALELLARVRHPDPGLIHDLGTGRGEMARLMAERWPAAEVVASDVSEAMLAVAARPPGRVRWERADAAAWDPPDPPDVVYSNAALHWVDDHERLFGRLAGTLRPGGVLAVQMPLNWSEPSHELMRRCLDTAGPGGTPVGPDELRARLARPPVAAPETYHEWLSGLLEPLDVWVTTYWHVLSGDDPVFDWVSGSALRPVLDSLDDRERHTFLGAYREALSQAYPRRTDGTTLFPFTRLFLVGTRRGT